LVFTSWSFSSSTGVWGVFLVLGQGVFLFIREDGVESFFLLLCWRSQFYTTRLEFFFSSIFILHGSFTLFIFFVLANIRNLYFFFCRHRYAQFALAHTQGKLVKLCFKMFCLFFVCSLRRSIRVYLR